MFEKKLLLYILYMYIYIFFLFHGKNSFIEESKNLAINTDLKIIIELSK